MPDIRAAAGNPRAVAIADLLAALEGLLATYQVLPELERETRWAADADRISGEISRQLAAARTRLSPSFDPSPVSSR